MSIMYGTNNDSENNLLCSFLMISNDFSYELSKIYSQIIEKIIKLESFSNGFSIRLSQEVMSN